MAIFMHLYSHIKLKLCTDHNLYPNEIWAKCSSVKVQQVNKTIVLLFDSLLTPINLWLLLWVACSISAIPLLQWTGYFLAGARGFC